MGLEFYIPDSYSALFPKISEFGRPRFYCFFSCVWTALADFEGPGKGWRVMYKGSV